jgi:pimeloyl-ACP methyl ester carboxylesterase
MLELAQLLIHLEWRRRGAVMREVPVAGSRIWYADFQPPPPRAARRSGRWEIPPGRKPNRRAPTMVLFHGLGGSSASFYPLVPYLRAAYRVIIPDLPGCGASRPPHGKEFLTFAEQVDVAERFVARLAPRGAFLAGNSMGGWIAVKLAARRPELVQALALLNPGGPALRAEDWVDFARIIWAEEKGTTEEWLRRTFHRPPLTFRLFLRDFRRIMKGPSVARLMTTLQAEDFLSDEEMARVRSPAVLVWGERDRLIPDGCRAFYLKKLKGVRYEPVPDCGHCPQLECPDRTAEILLDLPAWTERRRVRAGAGGSAAVSAAPHDGCISAVARAPKG